MKTEILVIGSGPGGSSVAEACANAGKKVTIVDKYFGGVCALRGCTPKKAMETITSAYWSAKAYEKAGFPTTTDTVDWQKLQAHQSKFTSLVPRHTKEKFEELGVTVVEGEASFVDAHTIQVGDQKIEAQQIVIATGAKSFVPDMEGADLMITNTEFFQLKNLPQRVTIVGGGYIGFEFSHILAACGAEVTILSADEKPLRAFDAELVDYLVQATLAKGIDIKLGYKATAVAEKNGVYNVTAQRTDNKEFDLEADLVINASGRIPAVDALRISKAGLELNEQNGVSVNQYLQAKGQKHIHALGDVIGEYPFTEIANYEAEIIINNLLEDRRKSVDYEGTPMGVFTHPQLATVGKSADEIEVEFETKEGALEDWFFHRTHFNDFAYFKIYVDKSDQSILGGELIGEGANDMINLIAIAIQKNLKVEDMKSLLMTYPSGTEEVKSFFE